MRNALGLLMSVLCGTALSAQDRPNIVLIFTDDQGMHDVGCYGSEIPTPHIDSLARDGLKFTSCYTVAAVCTPSRFGLLTGRNPSRSHDRLLFALMFMEEEDSDRGIQKGETTIASVLAKSGYDTALLGKWHLGHGRRELLPNQHGFDLFRGHTGGCIDYFSMTYGNLPDWYHNQERVDRIGYATELIAEDAVTFLKGRAGNTKPFFLYLAFNAPHFGTGWDPKAQKPINIMQAQSADLKRVANATRTTDRAEDGESADQRSGSQRTGASVVARADHGRYEKATPGRAPPPRIAGNHLPVDQAQRAS